MGVGNFDLGINLGLKDGLAAGISAGDRAQGEGWPKGFFDDIRCLDRLVEFGRED